MKPHRSFTGTCLQKTLLAPSVYELRCEKPTDFSFKAGQFVLFDVPLPLLVTALAATVFPVLELAKYLVRRNCFGSMC